MDVSTLSINNNGVYAPDTRTITWFIGELQSKQQGSISFGINVNQNAPDNAEVINFATVYFPSVPETTRTNGTVNRITTATDATPPATVISASPEPNSNGWNNSNVTITLTATDNEGGSGLSKTEYSLDNINWTTYASPFTIANEGTTKVYYKSIDNSNNTESLKSLEIKIDKTPPNLTSQASPQPNANGWNNSDVTITFTASDNLSGIASVTEPISITTEGKDQHIGGEAIDLAGNYISTYVTLNIDKTPPTITAQALPQPNANGWNNSDVTVSFTATDSLSGIQSFSQPITVTTEGAGQSIAGEAVDYADNKATVSIALNIDKTPPQLALELRPINLSKKEKEKNKEKEEGEGNWYELIYSATDTLAGLKNLQAGLKVISITGFKQELETDKGTEIEIDEKKKKLKIEAPNPQAVLKELREGLFTLNNGQRLQLKIKQGDPKWKIKEKEKGIEIQSPSVIFKAIASDYAGNTATKETEFKKKED